MSEVINPCPSCGNRNVAVGRHATDGRFVYCQRDHSDDYRSSCLMIGPCCDSESGAVITWNLFKLDWGWLPNATAPKDGTLIQALVLSSTGKTIPIHVKYSPGPDDPGEGEGPGWFCPETGVEYWPHELKGWRHIPPIPL